MRARDATDARDDTQRVATVASTTRRDVRV
jgi:hypothetical protein